MRFLSSKIGQNLYTNMEGFVEPQLHPNNSYYAGIILDAFSYLANMLKIMLAYIIGGSLHIASYIHSPLYNL